MDWTTGTKRVLIGLAVAVAAVVGYDVGRTGETEDPVSAAPVVEAQPETRRGLDETPLLYPAEFVRDLSARLRGVFFWAEPSEGAGSAGLLMDAEGRILIAYTSRRDAWRIQGAADTIRGAQLVAVDAVHGVALLRAELDARPQPLPMAPVGEVGQAEPLVALRRSASGMSARTLTAPGQPDVFARLIAEQGLLPGEAIVDLDGRILGFVAGGIDGPVLLDASLLQEIVSALSTDGVHRHPWLGADLQDIDATLRPFFETGTMVVVDVVEGSPAHEAGLRGGMALAEVQGGERSETTVAGVEELIRHATEVTVVPTGRRSRPAPVVVGDRQVPERFASSPDEGIVAVPAASVEVDVLPGWPAAESGLRPGDVIEAVDRRPPRTRAEVLRVLSGERPRLLTIRRGSARRFVVFPPPAPPEGAAQAPPGGGAP